jgi:hypothetical protein
MCTVASAGIAVADTGQPGASTGPDPHVEGVVTYCSGWCVLG